MHTIARPSLFLILLVASLLSPSQARAFYQSITGGSGTTNWNLEESGAGESITATGDGWITEVGGYPDSTHYARLRYKTPEHDGLALTTVYMKSVIVLPADFYTQHESSLRLMNTDNFGTTVGGTQYGTTTPDELRLAVYINSNQTYSLKSNHQNGTNLDFYTSSAPLPVGEHTLEVYGNMETVAPWYFKVDGTTIASGTDRLSPDSVLSGEREATRLMVGIDGAAGQDTKVLNLLVKSFVIADYDVGAVSASPSPSPTTTPTPTPSSSSSSSSSSNSSTSSNSNSSSAPDSSSTTTTLPVTGNALPTVLALSVGFLTFLLATLLAL